MDSNHQYRGTKAADLGSIPGIAEGSNTEENGVGAAAGGRLVVSNPILPLTRSREAR